MEDDNSQNGLDPDTVIDYLGIVIYDSQALILQRLIGLDH